MTDVTGTLVDERLNHLESRLATGGATQTDITHFLVNHYYASLHRLALSIVQQSQEAADVAQRTIIKASEKIDQYRPGTNFKAWVFKICVNEARTSIRRRVARERLQKIITLGLRTSAPPLLPEARLIQSERNAAIWHAVANLPEKQRLPILLRYNFEMSDQEICEILDVPYGTIRSRLHHAHKKLYAVLGNADFVSHREVTK